MNRFTSVATGLLVAIVIATAQEADPPERVGRLNFISGNVSFQPAGVTEWEAVNANRPITTGDRLWTDVNSRAELNIGTAVMRIDSRTAFEFLNLDDSNVQVRLTQGSIQIKIRALADTETFEIDTPNLAFSMLRTGEYRLDVDPDRMETLITVRSGQGDVTGGGKPFIVRPREQARVSGIENGTYDIVAAPAFDSWDNWCRDREQREERSESAKYVSREMVGYQDLDEHGVWSEIPEYGPVWAPREVGLGWAPYRDGRWSWIEPWGWTWVDDAPWGFAPFHYGRWVYAGRWVWVPGPVRVRPVYAPALVAWVGGPRFGVGISTGGGGGHVGWFPLGPREVYVPSRRASANYIRRVNQTNTVVNNINVTNVYNTTNQRYVNREAPGALTAVPQSAMAGGGRVQRSAVPIRSQDLASGQVLTNAPVAPTRGAVFGRSAGANMDNVARPPAGAMDRQVFARRTPPPPPVPFSERQGLLTRDPGKPLDPAQIQSLQSQRSGDRPEPRIRQAREDSGRGGFRRAGEPAAVPQQQPAIQQPRVERPEVQDRGRQEREQRMQTQEREERQRQDAIRIQRQDQQRMQEQQRIQEQQRGQDQQRNQEQQRQRREDQQRQPTERGDRERPQREATTPAPVQRPAEERRVERQERRQQENKEAPNKPRERREPKPDKQ